MLIASVTGLAITFAGSLLHAETSAFGAVGERPDGERVDMSVLLARAKAEAGSTFVPLGYLGPNAEITTPVEMIYGLASSDDERTKVVTFDPGSGDPLGSFLLNETLTHGLIDLHAELLLGPLGAILAAATGVGIVGLTIVGLVLWWPTDGRFGSKADVFKLEGTPTRKAWRIHSLIGLWLSVPVLLWGLSGAYWSKPDWLPRPFTANAPTLPGGSEVTFEAGCADAVSAVDAVATARALYPDARLLEAHFAAPWQSYHALHLTRPGDTDLPDGDIRVWVHATCVGIVAVTDDATLGGMLKSVHSGRIFGVLRLPVLLTVGSALLAASVTGLWLWSVRSFGTVPANGPRRRSRQRFGKPPSRRDRRFGEGLTK